MRIRPAARKDAAAIADIYAPFVESTTISFETDAPSAHEMAARVERVTKTYPWLVAETGDGLAGYAYASRHRTRAAYRWSVEVAVYIREEARRQGAARALYARLFEILAAQNFHAAFAGIALPNEASLAFHEAMGFEPVGVYREVGYKLGAWRDVSWWRRVLSRSRGAPAEPIAFAALKMR